ncbi:MAG TPA: PQQ-dependent sugar dehydrogenase [Fimbriimonadaceae bacterium]|nr:PQQ-dependent sugar dehydrogenase [Fimbriimonadaceae bacterium]
MLGPRIGSFVPLFRSFLQRRFGLVSGILVGLSLLACGGGGGGAGGGSTGYSVSTVVFLSNLATQIRFAPDGRIFFTELATGRIRIVQNGTVLPTEFATLPVGTSGEQGLLGLALDPNFAQNGFVYVFHTNPNPLKQRVVRYTDSNNVGTNETVIVDDLPVANRHVGGRIGFGQDGMLYVSIGDVLDPANSQDDNSLAGKILRYTPLGAIPGDNPNPASPVYAKGMRNSFGLAFHPTSGRPYTSENGPNCDDELNRIVAGGNYGWRPNYPCNDNDPNYIQPIVRYSEVIAPTGIAFYTGNDIPGFTGDLFVGSFNDGALRRYRIEDLNGSILASELILSGRPDGIIDVTTGSDGALYFCDGVGIHRVVPG